MNAHEKDGNITGIEGAFGRVVRDDIENALDDARRTGRLARAIGAAAVQHQPARSLFGRGSGRALRWAWVGLALVGGSVFGAGLWRARERPVIALPTTHPATPRAASAPMPPPVITAVEAPAFPPPPTPPAPRRAHAPAGIPDEKERPATLFASGNEARRAGRYPEAERLYERLQQRYIDSPEANVSRVALGRLLLDRNRALPRALRLFDEYLRLEPRGALAEQALAGRALAFRKLGRRDEEERAWRRLLDTFPDSPHAAEARVSR